MQKDAFTYILSMFCDFYQVIKQRKKPLTMGFYMYFTYLYVSGFSILVHQTRFELARLLTRPSSVRVYQFRHWCIFLL